MWDNCFANGRERSVDLSLLKPGHKIRTRGGAEAEVLSETVDGEWIRVRHLYGEGPSPSGTEDLVHRDEVEALLGLAVRNSWGEKVTIIVHYRPEDEDFGGGYEATTITGMPYNVIATAEDEDSAEGALNHLLDGLRAFGFRGRISVEDATYIGGVQRYEVDLSG